MLGRRHVEQRVPHVSPDRVETDLHHQVCRRSDDKNCTVRMCVNKMKARTSYYLQCEVLFWAECSHHVTTVFKELVLQLYRALLKHHRVSYWINIGS